MAKIKKISYRNIFHIKKLISVISSDNIMSYRRLFFLSVPITFIQNLVYSVLLRRFTETYVVSDNNNVLKGVISVKAQHGNPYKWQIKRLLLAKNSHEEGKQLVEYIIAKFGARGVDTFYVAIDDLQHDLIDLFIKGCGFRLCGYETLWHVTNINFIVEDIDTKFFKPFKDEDAQLAADLFNSTLITHYKYSLSKEKEEFADRFFQGLNFETNFKYTLNDEKSNYIKSFIEIKTLDNVNYFIDTIVPPQYFELYPQILSFAVKEILKRTKKFHLYIKNRKYLQGSDQLENFFKENKFELLQNNAVLVRDFFKPIKENKSVYNEAVILSGFEI